MNDTTFQGNGSVKYVPVVVNAKLTKPITNADRIRSMTDEELADEILKWFNWLNAVEWDEDRIINWLKQEAET